MKSYEDLLEEKVQNLTGKLAQKQREGNLAEELPLCARLAQLHGQLGKARVSVQFWQSCMQIAADLNDIEEEWRAAAEISKIYCKNKQIENAEDFMTEHLKPKSHSNLLRLALLKAEVISAMASKNDLRLKNFESYERALRTLDDAINESNCQNIWWWDAVAFRAELLLNLGKFEESRWEEAIEVVKAIQERESVSVSVSETIAVSRDNSKTSINILMSLRCKVILSKIYFEMGEYASALEMAISAIDQYKSDPLNANYRPRRRFYCEMLLMAGWTLRFQKDFQFSLQNLLIAKEEAHALTVERELMEEIERATRETLAAEEASHEAAKLQRKKSSDPRDLEEIAEKFGIIGDFHGQIEVLERCREFATSESSQKRLDRKLLELHFHKSKSWQEMIKLTSEISPGWRGLLMRSRALEKLGKWEEAEVCLLDALREGNGALSVQIALYFHYRQRGKLEEARKFREEVLSLETVSQLNSHQSVKLIDPDFSYFVTRKPSSALMKMVGSGMVMRSKTKKKTGLHLKRRRAGPSKLKMSGSRRNFQDGSDSEGLSDFIVSDSDGDLVNDCESVKRPLHNSVRLEKSKPFTVTHLVISDDSDTEPSVPVRKTQPSHKTKASHSTLNNNNKHVTDYNSPLMIRTESLDVCFPLDPDSSALSSPLPKHQDIVTFDDNNVKKVIVRVKKGTEILIPVVNCQQTVRDLINLAQIRFNRLFPEEAKKFGPISGLKSTILETNVMLFPDDPISLVLSRDLEVLQAHFDDKVTTKSVSVSSPSKFNSIEEDFKRRFQILSLKPDGSTEIKSLKLLQDRLKSSSTKLDLSALSLDTQKLSDYSPFISKFLKMSPNISCVTLSENLLCDEDDLKFLSGSNLKEIDLSMNFLQKPNFLKDFQQKQQQQNIYINLAYNPIDPTWLVQNAHYAKGLNLIGCGELEQINLGNVLKRMKRLHISFVSADFLKELSSVNCEIEVLLLFACNLDGSLVHLSYMDNLQELIIEACRVDSQGIEGLCKVLKRNFTLKKLILNEIEWEDEDVDLKCLREEGINQNVSLSQVILDDVIIYEGNKK